MSVDVHSADEGTDPDFLAYRRCMREPIPEIMVAAQLLSLAADAHLAGDREAAAAALREADMPAVKAWTDSLWGSPKRNPDQPLYRRYRRVADAPPLLAKPDRLPVRMPSPAEKKRLAQRWGFRCAFCGIPVVRAEVRKLFHSFYPEAVPWEGTVATQHAAFECMWLQFDHVVPHSRGGDNSAENVVVTCAGCNFGRMQHTLAEVGISDPRLNSSAVSSWDGLERVMPAGGWASTGKT